MNEPDFDNPQDNRDKEGRFAFSMIKAARALPGAKVDRASFLKDQLRVHCPSKQVGDAIKSNPAHACKPGDQIDDIANSVIKSHVAKAAAGSFVAGIPGGLAMAVAIPVDTTQFIWHSIVLAQKLAYLYGWPELLQEGDPDEETQFRMVLLVGSMLGIGKANQILAAIAKQFAHQVGQRLPRYALTKTVYYPLIKTILKWVGIKLTKQSFARGVAKLIPLVSGGISAVMTTIALRPMARNLKNHLRELEYAQRQSD